MVCLSSRRGSLVRAYTVAQVGSGVQVRGVTPAALVRKAVRLLSGFGPKVATIIELSNQSPLFIAGSVPNFFLLFALFPLSILFQCGPRMRASKCGRDLRMAMMTTARARKASFNAQDERVRLGFARHIYAISRTQAH